MSIHTEKTRLPYTYLLLILSCKDVRTCAIKKIKMN